MNRRQRILTALARGIPDRPPISFRADPCLMEKIITHYGAKDVNDLYRARGIDGLNLWGWHNIMPDYTGPKKTAPDGTELDFWGNAYPNHHALIDCDTIADIESFAWPSADDFDYSKVYERALEIRQADMVSSGAYIFLGFQPHASFRGNEKIFYDLTDEDYTHCLVEHLTRFNVEFMDRLLSAGKGEISLVQTSDDMGTMDRLMLSPEAWRKFYKPDLKKAFDIVHGHGAKIWFHSCGYVGPLLEDFIEIGADCWNTFDPIVKDNEPERVHKICKNRIALDGGVSQTLFVSGKPEDIRKETRKVLERFAPDGGLLIGPTQRLTEDVPLENAVAFFETALEYKG